MDGRQTFRYVATANAAREQHAVVALPSRGPCASPLLLAAGENLHILDTAGHSLSIVKMRFLKKLF